MLSCCCEQIGGNPTGVNPRCIVHGTPQSDLSTIFRGVEMDTFLKVKAEVSTLKKLIKFLMTDCMDNALRTHVIKCVPGIREIMEEE